jgi:uncharacterized Zn-finger protein
LIIKEPVIAQQPEESNRSECELCGKVFASVVLLKFHAATHTPRLFAATKIKCSFKMCPLIFSSSEAMKKHRQEEHCSRIFRCTTKGCSFQDTKLKALQKHRIEKHILELLICCICGKEYHSPSSRSQHLQIHSNMEFRCLVVGCNEIFNTAEELQHHVDQHHVGLKKFECKVCGRVVLAIKLLNQHMLQHTLVCKVPDCSFSSETRNELKSHIKSVHFSCKLCGQYYKNSTDLQEHSKCHKARVAKGKIQGSN